MVNRGATIASPSQPMSHVKNVKITFSNQVNIRSAAVTTDISENIYLTAVDETFMFFKFDNTLTIKQTYHRRIFKGTYSNPTFNGHFNVIGSYIYSDSIFFGFSGTYTPQGAKTSALFLRAKTLDLSFDSYTCGFVVEE